MADFSVPEFQSFSSLSILSQTDICIDSNQWMSRRLSIDFSLSNLYSSLDETLNELQEPTVFHLTEITPPENINWSSDLLHFLLLSFPLTYIISFITSASPRVSKISFCKTLIWNNFARTEIHDMNTSALNCKLISPDCFIPCSGTVSSSIRCIYLIVRDFSSHKFHTWKSHPNRYIEWNAVFEGCCKVEVLDCRTK